MPEKIYITNENIKKYAKVQGTSAMVERDQVVLMWDELDREGKRLAKKHIEIEDIEVVTSDPYNVPDKWNDNVRKEGEEMQAPDMIKQVIANPSRADVFQMLMDQDPPEPLMLWWVDVCFSDPDYFKVLADTCHHGLFKTDPRYLWGTIAFGVEDGEGRFHWPSNDDDTVNPELKKEALKNWEAPEKEVSLAWDTLGRLADELVDHESGTDDGGTEDADHDRDADDHGAAGLL